jgi:hypothetical protein
LSEGSIICNTANAVALFPTSVHPDASLNVLYSQSDGFHVILFTPRSHVWPIRMVGIGYRLAHKLRAFAKNCPKRK